MKDEGSFDSKIVVNQNSFVLTFNLNNFDDLQIILSVRDY